MVTPLEHPGKGCDDLKDDDAHVGEQKAHEHDKGKYPDLGRDLHGLRLEPLELQLLHIVTEHLKIHRPVVAPQHADEPTGDVGEHGRVEPCLKTGQGGFVAGGAHIGGEDVQLGGEVLAGVFLKVLDHGEDVPAGFQLLGDGRHEPGQLLFDPAPLFRQHLVRPADLLEIDDDGEDEQKRRQQGQDDERRDNSQPNGSRLHDGLRRELLRRDRQPRRRQHPRHAAALIFVHADEAGQLDRRGVEQGVAGLGLCFGLLTRRQHRLLGGELGQTQQVGGDEKESSGKEGSE